MDQTMPAVWKSLREDIRERRAGRNAKLIFVRKRRVIELDKM